MSFSETIKLVAPTSDESLKLSEAIIKRRSIRQYDGHDLTDQQLANLCYYTAGVTDAERGMVANPTACFSQEILLYVVTSKVCALYDPREHALKVIEKGDFRAEMAIQPFAKEASVQFVVVRKASRFAAMIKDNAEACNKYEHTDAGIMVQNTCLYATAIGLGSVIRGMYDDASVSKRLQLPADEKVILTVSVG